MNPIAQIRARELVEETVQELVQELDDAKTTANSFTGRKMWSNREERRISLFRFGKKINKITLHTY
jgi:tetrahydromethanopterin S-methyltransferase subunit B